MKPMKPMKPNEPQEQSVVTPSRGPILYTNDSIVTVGSYDLTVSLACESRYAGGKGSGVTQAHVATLAMSHNHAWVLACLMLRQLGAVVQRNGMFAVPAELVEQLGLQAEHKDMAALADSGD